MIDADKRHQIRTSSFVYKDDYQCSLNFFMVSNYYTHDGVHYSALWILPYQSGTISWVSESKDTDVELDNSNNVGRR